MTTTYQELRRTFSDISRVKVTTRPTNRPYEVTTTRIMTDVEKYLFDVLGCVALEEVLSADVVADIIQIIGRQDLETPRAGDAPIGFGEANENRAGLLERGKPLCVYSTTRG